MSPLKSRPQLVKDFWPKFRRKTALGLVIIQVISLGLMAAFLYSIEIHKTQPIEFIVIIVLQALLGAAVSLSVYHLVSKPLQIVLASITHISGEPTTIKPPNPNEKRVKKWALSPVVQTVYQLSSGAEISKPLEINQEDEHSASSSTSSARFIPNSDTQSTIATAIDQATPGFVVYNAERRVIFANKSAPISVDSNGTPTLDLVFHDRESIFDWWDDCEKNAVRAERTWPRISNKMPNEENRRFFDVIASYNKGVASEMVITLIDRTKLYEVGESDLDFIAFAAHELRGPITVIRGYIDVLSGELSGVLQDEHKELFRRLTVSANRLSGYVNNILNTSRYDRRHLRMHLTKSSMATVYDTIRDDMDLRARSQNRSLAVNIPTDLPAVAADVSSLSEVFSNIIDNAIKYSNEGGAITVTGQLKGDHVELSVEDRGIGMPSSVVSNLFQKFYRSHRSRETVAGTGIGLYISKAIVESHGGTISVRSEDGRGSVFTVSLPIYELVADKLKEDNNRNENIITASGSWIKNHNMYRG